MEEFISRKYRMLKDELNERQRRLWAASEALSLGYGGISQVAKATGILPWPEKSVPKRGFDKLYMYRNGLIVC